MLVRLVELPASSSVDAVQGLTALATTLREVGVAWAGIVIERPGTAEATVDDWAWWGAACSAFAAAGVELLRAVIAGTRGVVAFVRADERRYGGRVIDAA